MAYFGRLEKIQVHHYGTHCDDGAKHMGVAAFQTIERTQEYCDFEIHDRRRRHGSGEIGGRGNQNG